MTKPTQLASRYIRSSGGMACKLAMADGRTEQRLEGVLLCGRLRCINAAHDRLTYIVIGPKVH